jgi:hypothetical protein
MNELIEQVKSRVGLNDQQANSAVQTVIGFLKQRLPSPIASQLDGAISGSASQGGMMEGAKDKIGDMLGKKTA